MKSHHTRSSGDEPSPPLPWRGDRLSQPLGRGGDSLSPQAALPDGWRWVVLDEVCTHGTGTRDPRKEPEAPFRYVDISSVDNQSKLITQARTLPGKEAPSRARQVIRTNDVLVATTRPNLNAVTLVPAELDDAICSTGFCVLRSNGKVEPEFLFAFAQTEVFIRSLSEIVKGALYPAVTDGQVRGQKLPLPPLPEQRRIAVQLHDRLAVVAEARAALQAQISAARALPAAHLRAIFQSADARQWQMKRVEHFIGRPLRTGLSKPPSADSKARCLTLSAVRNGILDYTASKPVAVTEKEAVANAVQPETLYVVRGNGNISLVARGALAPTPQPHPVLFPDLLIEVHPNSSIVLPYYLRWVWESPEVRRSLEIRSTTSAGIYKINLTNLATVEIPVPSIPEQQAIIARCQAAAQEQTTLRESISARLTALDHLPAALLREAFAGRV